MYLLISFYIILFFLAFRYLNVFKINSLPPWVLPLAFLIKICIGGFYLTLYLHPDTNNLLPSDTMNYLNESKIVNRVFYESPKDYFYLLSGTGDDNYLIPKYLSNTFVWDSGSINIVNDSRNIIRLNSLIQFISFGIPFIHTLFMCFISLIGLRHLFLTFENLTNINPLLFFSLLFFLPSLLFWTSGILKEPILFFGLSIFTRSLLKKDAFKKRFFFGCIGVLILLGIKPYVIASLLLSIFYFILYKYIFKEKIVASCIGFTLCLLISLTFFSTLRQKITLQLNRIT